MKYLPIGDFCVTGSGGTPSRSNMAEFYDAGTIPWIKSGELANSIVDRASEFITEKGLEGSSAKLLQPGAILVAMYGATVGQVSRLTISAATNQAICHIYPDTKVCDQHYLYRVLKGARDELLQKRVGGGQPNISQGILREFKVPLPPLPKQKRISQILDAADALRAKRHESIAQLDALVKSTFLEMFGDPVTNPIGWPQVSLATLVRDGDKINYGVVQPGEHVIDGKPLVRVGDFTNGQLSTKNMKFIDPSIEKQYKRSRLTGDELLISCVGSIGNICAVNESAKGYNIARAVARVPLGKSVDRTFMLFCLRSTAVQQHFGKETRTVSQPTLNIALIKTAPVICPPISLQQKFATIVKSIQSQKFLLQTHLTELNTLFASLQSRAFNGEL